MLVVVVASIDKVFRNLSTIMPPAYKAPRKPDYDPGYRQYLAKLREAFPHHDEYDWIDIRSLLASNPNFAPHNYRQKLKLAKKIVSYHKNLQNRENQLVDESTRSTLCSTSPDADLAEVTGSAPGTQQDADVLESLLRLRGQSVRSQARRAPATSYFDVNQLSAASRKISSESSTLSTSTARATPNCGLWFSKLLYVT